MKVSVLAPEMLTMQKKGLGLAGGVAALLVLLGGCSPNPPTHQEIQQQAAQTTVAVKQDAKQAVEATKEAAAAAESDVNDIAIGVKSGLKQKGPAAAKLNINSAAQIQLAMLPGISMNKADEIISKRPYTDSHELVRRGILTSDEYEQIHSQISTR